MTGMFNPKPTKRSESYIPGSDDDSSSGSVIYSNCDNLASEYSEPSTDDENNIVHDVDVVGAYPHEIDMEVWIIEDDSEAEGLPRRSLLSIGKHTNTISVKMKLFMLRWRTWSWFAMVSFLLLALSRGRMVKSILPMTRLLEVEKLDDCVLSDVSTGETENLSVGATVEESEDVIIEETEEGFRW